MMQERLVPFVEKLTIEIDCHTYFLRVCGEEKNALWLDSPQHGDAEKGRYSYVALCRGPFSHCLSYKISSKLLIREEKNKTKHVSVDDLFSYLHAHHHVQSMPDLPFPFKGGYIGYFGYELRGSTEAKSSYDAPYPDAYLLYITRFLVVDHQEKCSYLCCLDTPNQQKRAKAWLTDQKALCHSLKQYSLDFEKNHGILPLDFDSHFLHSKDHYLQKIQQCQQWIKEGQAYQLCLCNRFQSRTTLADLDVYQCLRKNNPSPFSAFFRFKHFSFLSASPESFLSLSSEGVLQSKPIKGTAKRLSDSAADQAQKHDLENNLKERAENMMIVDLMRHDFNKVCQRGSVRVPHCLQIESYAGVHQLVSLVEGRLEKNESIFSTLSASFPGGSMTGAPKTRALHLLESLEEVPRGIYSGCFGWIGQDGAAHLAMTIRSLIYQKGTLNIGVGGGITILSETEKEWTELRVKLAPLLVC